MDGVPAPALAVGQCRIALTGEYEYIDLLYHGYRHGSQSNPIRVYRSDEVYRSAPYYDGSYKTVFLIWRPQHNPHPKRSLTVHSFTRNDRLR